MRVWRIGEPKLAEGWARKVFDFSSSDSIVDAKTLWEPPDWSERRIEHSLLRSPEILAHAIGREMPPDAVALGQVNEIDIYLRCHNEIHLFEIKGPKGPRAAKKWKPAAYEIGRQWQAAGAWLRRHEESVFLWTFSLGEFGRHNSLVSKEIAKEHAQVKRKHLQGASRAEIGAIFYNFFIDDRAMQMAVWRP